MTDWFDFSSLRGVNLQLNVEIGASTYWSELMQVQTLDNLFGKNLVDAETYLENMPRGYIPNRADILNSLKEKQQAAQEAQQAQAAQQLPAAIPETGQGVMA